MIFSHLQKSFRSVLVRRITFMVFLNIVVIEAILLVLSCFSERDRQLAQIDRTMSYVIASQREDSLERALTALFSTTETTLPNASEAQTATTQTLLEFPLLGFRYSTANGVVTEAGTLPQGSGWAERSAADRFVLSTGMYTVLMPITGSGYGSDAAVLLHIDARHVSGALGGFVLRIVMLVIVISAFVTLGCLVALNPILIHPVLQLAQLMQQANDNGVSSARPTLQQTSRNDEFGTVYRTFEKMRLALLESQQSLQETSSRFMQFADLGADLFWETDHRLRLNFVAGSFDSVSLDENAARQLLGKPLHVALNTCTSMVFTSRQLRARAAEAGQTRFRIDLFTTEEKWCCLEVSFVILRDHQGRLQGVRGTAADVTELARTHRLLKHRATHDSLTGLANRAAFLEAVEQVWELEDKSANFICVLDLDRFKQVNDSAGHAAGDEILVKVSSAIAAAINHTDVAARLGGDEFAILLKARSADQAMTTAQQILDGINCVRVHRDGQVFSVGCSIGVADIDAGFDTVESVLQAADTSCLDVKRTGRNWVSLHGQQQSIQPQLARQTPSLGKAADEADYQAVCVPVAAVAAEDGRCALMLSSATDKSALPSLPANGSVTSGAQTRVYEDRWLVEAALETLRMQQTSIQPGKGLPDFLIINPAGDFLDDAYCLRLLLAGLTARPAKARELCIVLQGGRTAAVCADCASLIIELRRLGVRTIMALDDISSYTMAEIMTVPVDFLLLDSSVAAVSTTLRKIIASAAARGIRTVLTCQDTVSASGDDQLPTRLAMARDIGAEWLVNPANHQPEALEPLLTRVTPHSRPSKAA